MALSDSQKTALRNPFQWLFEPTPKATSENLAQENPDGSIPRNELAGLMFGLLGQNQLYGMAGSRFFHFLTNVLHINTTNVGIMTGIITTYDACNDPIAGAIMDKNRFKNGQKLVPWIRYTSPLIAIFAFLMFVNWGYATEGQALVYSIIVYLLWDALYSFQDAGLWGLTAIISTRSEERARSVQWAEVGVTLGGLIPGLLGMFFSGSGLFGITQQNYYLVFAAILCLGGGFLSVAACRVNERVPSPPETISILKNIGQLKHNYILWLFILMDVLSNLSPRVEDVYLFQTHADYQLGSWVIPASVTVTILGAVTGIPSLVTKFVATKVIDRFGGNKKAMIVARLAGLVVRVIVYFIRIETLPRLILTRVVQMISSIPDSVNGVAMRTMIADSVDYVEWVTGRRTEGITMAMRNFQSKLCGAVGRLMQGLSLTFLQFNSRNVERNIPQNKHYQDWVWPVYQLGPGIGAILSLIPLLLLKMPDMDKIAADLAERRAERALAEGGEPVLVAVGADE